ncbi:MAG: tRNA (adenosine(37)-N6)-threonylcarbamoyltransferase complex ATPase subunit type 1 TsaE [Parcubacteria group bacterium]|nr:tRNA (adenosine(37)-N6)-threonylcarbamoyltransferase complex ATPase subunit type 1 TsaE [Parcubacteria group bacterium]MBI3074971.1 tRNA (adenosine(37)-N6)-threonylcarbamoyltransferase complex ATPase subunit type 1 TsaE [Parcubacteria group bacterium]
MERTTYHLEETTSLAREFVKDLAPHKTGATVVALYGDLGSGKTTFVQAAAQALGIDVTVISPTFVIERVYPIRNSSGGGTGVTYKKRNRLRLLSANNASKMEISNGAGKFANQKFDHFIHIDCYRIDASKEIALLGWDEKVKNPRNLIFVEWAERIEELLPPKTMRIYFEFVDESKRKIVIQNC